MDTFRFVVLSLLLAAVLLPSTLFAAQPLRLTELFAIRFVGADPANIISEAGLLNVRGEFRVFERRTLNADEVVPPAALNDFWLTGPTWFAYDVLGPETLRNFVVGSPPLFVGNQIYVPVALTPELPLNQGNVLNISTRAELIPSGPPVIAGFVIAEGERTVLIRAVGPGLSVHGVSNPASDPQLTVFRSGSPEPIAANDDWGTSADIVAIERAATGDRRVSSRPCGEGCCPPSHVEAGRLHGSSHNQKLDGWNGSRGDLRFALRPIPQTPEHAPPNGAFGATPHSSQGKRKCERRLI